MILKQHATRVAIAILLSCLIARILPAQEKHDDGDDATIPDWRYTFQEKYELFRDYGYDWRLKTLFALNPDDGLLIGAGPILYHFGFRTFPYVYRMELAGGFAIPTGRFKFTYDALWPAVSKRLSFELKAHASELEVRNFYGFGNDAPRDEAKESDGFYRVASREYSLQPTFILAAAKKATLFLGANLVHFEVRYRDDRFINSALGPSLEGITLGSLGIGLTVDTRDHALAPHKGVYLRLETWGSSPLEREDYFQKVAGDFRVYVGDTLVTDLMLALRLHGETVSLDFPFFRAAFLGGTGSLRGYPAERFAGNVAAFASAELRFSIGRWRMLVPTEVGLLALVDAGRVWVRGESPGELHTDVGGGIWIAPLSRDLILSFLAASSTEGVFLSGGVGFGF